MKNIFIKKRHLPDKLHLLRRKPCPNFIVVSAQMLNIGVNVNSMLSIELAVALQADNIAVF